MNWPKQGIIILSLLIAMPILSSCGPVKQPKPAAAPKASEQSIASKTDAASKIDNEERIYDYLRSKVPEIKDFEQQIETYNQQSKTDYKAVMRIDSKPDPGAENSIDRTYYYVYVGSDMGDHLSRWASFWVKSDLTDILVDDVMTGSPISLDAWRRTQADSGV